MNRAQRITEQLYGPGAAPEIVAVVRAGLQRVQDFREHIGADLRTYAWDRQSTVNGKDPFAVMTNHPEVAAGAPLILVEHIPSRRVVVADPIDLELYPNPEEQGWRAVTSWRLAIRILGDEMVVSALRSMTMAGRSG